MEDDGRGGSPGAAHGALHRAGGGQTDKVHHMTDAAGCGTQDRRRQGRSGPVEAARPACLTARELECLAWAAQGKSEWEMSRILGISEHTAEKHLINARVKLGAVNRVHAVAMALRRGVIP